MEKHFYAKAFFFSYTYAQRTMGMIYATLKVIGAQKVKINGFLPGEFGIHKPRKSW